MFQAQVSIADNLKLLINKRAFVILRAGKEIKGTVKEVGPQLVHLELTDNMKMFEAVINIDSIAGVYAIREGYMDEDSARFSPVT